MANVGKIFETDFKNSVPENCVCLRLYDSATGFGRDSSKVRFSMKSPFDFLLFKSPKMYCLELKSTAKKSLGFERKGDKTKREIHWHQIEALSHYSTFENTVCGFVFNFRERGTYFVEITEFIKFYHITTKKSISIDDIMELKHLVIPSKQKQVHYLYKLNALLDY